MTKLKIIDAVVDKIVPPQPPTSLDVIVETYGSIISRRLHRLTTIKKHQKLYLIKTMKMNSIKNFGY